MSVVCNCQRDYLTVPLDGGCLDPFRSPLEDFAADVHQAVVKLAPRLSFLEQDALEAQLSGESYEETARRLRVPKRAVENAASRARAKTKAFADEIASAA